MVVRLSTRLSPERVVEEATGVQAPHAVADDVDRLVGKGPEDPVSQSAGAELDPGYGMDPRHQHTVSRRPKVVRNPAKIGGQGQRPQPNARESEKPMGHHNRRFEPCNHLVWLSEFGQGILAETGRVDLRVITARRFTMSRVVYTMRNVAVGRNRTSRL